MGLCPPLPPRAQTGQPHSRRTQAARPRQDVYRYREVTQDSELPGRAGASGPAALSGSGLAPVLGASRDLLTAQSQGGPSLFLTRACALTERLFFTSAPQLRSRSTTTGAVLGSPRLGPRDLTVNTQLALFYTSLEWFLITFIRPTQCPVLGRGARYPHNGLFQGQSYLLYKFGTESNVCE